ncbi:RecX family transcriptional regulator [Microbacterium sp. SYP-A9085]|uniref:regulatory protein RecX n=1 Tax=Microbacterium sp. SYP-A9085 TaxID=2664454 RepID=UPI00129A7FFF|nr:regulatory protein RecX [Microbacterium sp. SYP-A9085]MRH29250.1 RecX family transcriptional regulator [Microbacterium sp. SYP-A9085]
MTPDDGGEQNGLAPVIPLFGGPAPATERGDAAGAERPTAAPSAASRDTPTWHTVWDEPDDDALDEDALDDAARSEREAAERSLTRKLRTRQLSVSEGRVVLAAHSLDADVVAAVLHAFERRGYLDDRALAEQLVHSAVQRKGQGRAVIAQTLAKRGLRRDVIDLALAELPDDDAERALEFARQKARSMRGLERDVALRRLAGQLARRGYGAAALDAARRALDELG